MRKLISSINLTLDGFCDHTAVIVDDQLHRLAIQMLDQSDTVLFGRTTYRLFESYWPGVAATRQGPGHFIEFADKIDAKEKVVFSRTKQELTWQNSHWLGADLAAVVGELKQQPKKDILIFGSPGLLNQLIQLDLVDEYCIYMQPVMLGKGNPFSHTITEKIIFRLVSSRQLDSGVMELIFKRR
jgi:dihydrofolate reductase